ncbi:PHD finger protein ALFIN-LIKE 8 [Hibiscus syriacus]|uniref:PHD finger protein ALFIN-LIKE n=1 Tax=Hibiscus syriacus TaxID=106335 RepID=A0A6A2ZCD7_HIBSY|nr:PHD finger protein ALFIN-LIKE 8 [Hibiscus syriacus]
MVMRGTCLAWEQSWYENMRSTFPSQSMYMSGSLSPLKDVIVNFGFAKSSGTWKRGCSRLVVSRASAAKIAVPPELPEPALGINFAKDGMQEKDWLSLVAVHSDSMLLAVAFYFGARFGFDKADRKRLFNMINDLPTIFEVVTGVAKKQRKNRQFQIIVATNLNQTLSEVLCLSPSIRRWRWQRMRVNMVWKRKMMRSTERRYARLVERIMQLMNSGSAVISARNDSMGRALRLCRQGLSILSSTNAHLAATRECDLDDINEPAKEYNWVEKTFKREDWLTRKRDSLMVMASLMATMSFQAGLTPPGGLWQDGLIQAPQGNNITNGTHETGTSISAYRNESYYGQYLAASMISFIASMSIILLLITGLPFKRRFFMWILTVIMWVAISAMAFTYRISLLVFTPKEQEQNVTSILDYAHVVWLLVMALLLLAHTIRLTVNIFHKVDQEVAPKRRPTPTLSYTNNFDI